MLINYLMFVFLCKLVWLFLSYICENTIFKIRKSTAHAQSGAGGGGGGGLLHPGTSELPLTAEAQLFPRQSEIKPRTRTKYSPRFLT